ncbi:purine permease 1 [Amborella trichopoda]|uniref:purine permease 1 n=1 Tax=Amborella trichopoda TaxID=13333 RepID=UPI0005D2FAE9|nr:purine permease 1 [Amborella trichopoda]|eukprot:XP_011622178.1 purine permease 1 [Amborella trichopoda]
MNEETTTESNTTMTTPKKKTNRLLLLLTVLLLVAGGTGAPLVSRLYFIHGGQRKWLTAWIQTAAFPILLIPLSLSKFSTRKASKSERRQPHLTFPLALQSAAIGLLFGLGGYMYAFGLSYLPISTSSLLVSTQLGFTAFFAFLIVGQRLTTYTINAVVLLSLGSVLLALRASGDKPKGVTGAQYGLGFVLTLGAAALLGLVFPLIELVYVKSKHIVTFGLAMEMLLLLSVVATGFCTMGMLINKDFQVIAREAKEFGLGEFKYYVTVVASGILWQVSLIGSFGFVLYTTSLLNGILMAVQLPLNSVLAVIFFHEKFSGEKGLALVLCLWGLASYCYGEHIQSKEEEVVRDIEINHL